MREPTNRELIDAINHNAGLLEKHLNEGSFVHTQTEPNTIWKIEHKLGSMRPLIETYDTAGNKIGHGVNRSTQTFDYAEVTFVIPMAGTAILRF